MTIAGARDPLAPNPVRCRLHTVRVEIVACLNIWAPTLESADARVTAMGVEDMIAESASLEVSWQFIDERAAK